MSGATKGRNHSRGLVLAICYIGFISLGLPDTLIGVAWPSIREHFQLEQSHVSWIFVGSGCSYFVSSFFAGRLLKAMNVGVLLAASSGLVALSGFNYSLASAWPWFALGSLLHGLGSGAIDAGLNHYVANHFSARHMNWLHACYSLGAMLGPLIMTAMITQRGSWRMGYFSVAATLSLLALLFIVTRRRWDDPAQPVAASPSAGDATEPVTGGKALRQTIVWLHIALFFIYTGVEVTVGQWSFTLLTEGRAVSAEVAGIWVSLYWGSILAGRILFGFVVDRIGIDRLLRSSLLAALIGAGLLAWNPFPLSAPIALILAGLGLAAIYPCLMTRTPQRMGRDVAAHAIGYQVGAAMLGAAALPSLTGFVAQNAGVIRVAPVMLGMAIALFLLHEFVLLRDRSSTARR